MTLKAESLACVRGERPIFSGLEFELMPGGALVLSGPNGAGKSSLLRLAAGFLRPADGLIAWNGEDLWADVEGHRRRLGYIGHLDAVKPLLTVAENVEFWLRLYGGAGAAEAALEAFGIAHLAAVPAGLLSAGQRKRTALARLVAAPRPLWLLDEPGVSLDDDGLARLAGAIVRHREGGGMVMAATHLDLAIAEAPTLVLDAGRGRWR